MREFALACCALLAFLLPVGAYFLFLASVNRRGKPLIVSGAWDAVGLLFAGSGFFLVTAPMLFSEFSLHLGFAGGDTFFSDWLRNWILWMIYFLLLVSGGALMILWRSHKTIVYNVDGEQFAKVLEQALAALHLGTTKNKERLILTPASPAAASASTAIMEASPAAAPAAAPADDRYAELKIENFPMMCHVTLHWENYTAEARQDIERELERTLAMAAPHENPAAGWFLSVGGFLFGALIVFMFAVVFLLLFGGA